MKTSTPTILETQLSTAGGRDQYMAHFKTISTPGNGNQFNELANAYKSLWNRGVSFPTRLQLLNAASSWA